MNAGWRSAPLDVTRHDGPAGTVILSVTGEIDISSVEPLAVAARDALADPAVSQLVIDLAQVPFMDSTGIRTLLDAWRLAADRGATVTVTNPTGLPLRVLRITGVLDVLTGRLPDQFPGGA